MNAPSRPPQVAVLIEAGNAHVRERRWDEAVAAFRRALALDPGVGLAFGALGYCYEQLGQAEEAIAAYTTAAALSPDNPEIVFNLGNVLRALGRLDEAEAAYRRTLAVDRAHARGLNNLGTVLHSLGRADEAIAVYHRAIAIKPDYAEARNNLGGAHIAKNEIPEALRAYREGLAIDGTMDRAHFNVGVARLLAGDLPAGWTGYEHRAAPSGRTPPSGRRWNDGESLEGKTLLLTCEQGLGDSIQFVRYVPQLRRLGAKVGLEVQPPLKRLFASAGADGGLVAVGEPLPAHDLHCSFLSLPFAFATSLDSIPAPIPYLAAPPAHPFRWRQHGRDRLPRIGFAWAGNPSHKHDRWRSLALPAMLGALRTADAELVSLQKERTAAEAALLAAQPQIVDAAGLLHDFADTAAIIADLDLVIAVDTAVAHLAGALGKPVWILLPFSPDWRWMLGRTNSPWYPTARLFRQPQLADWPSVLANVSEALRTVQRF